jgi:RimJ/RimL family protein N-acetyltransferase
MVEKPSVYCEVWEGERILLRRPQADDMITVYEKWASDPEVTKYLAWATHQKPEDADVLLYMSDTMWDEYGCGPLIIELRDSGEIIGSAGLLFDGADGVGVGYVLRKEYQRKGYASEALGLSIEIARKRGVDRLVAGIHPTNIPSRKVAKRNGFTLAEEKSSKAFVFPQIDPDKKGYAVFYELDLTDKG